MAKANTFLATDPTGVVHKRTSQNRTYTHCVAYRPSYELNFADAKKPQRNDASNFAWHVERLAQSYESWLSEHAWRTKHYTDEQNRAEYAAEIERHTQNLRGATSVIEYSNARINERVAKIEQLKADGYYEKWIVEGWQGRPDLANKALASLRKRGSGGWFAISEAVILTVTKKEA